jgi:hypothetical protein
MMVRMAVRYGLFLFKGAFWPFIKKGLGEAQKCSLFYLHPLPRHVYAYDRIALVEDDKLIREGFSLLISSTYGYRVVGAYGSCEEALKHLSETNRKWCSWTWNCPA